MPCNMANHPRLRPVPVETQWERNGKQTFIAAATTKADLSSFRKAIVVQRSE